MKKNIILAGVARSGSTLTCHLLNKSKNTIALLEPISPKHLSFLSNEDKISYILKFFEAQRVSILDKGYASSKSKNGKVPDNLIGGVNEVTGKREGVLDGDRIEITKKLTSDFALVVKQPGLFTGMLGILKQHFACYATVRNPLAILQSWNTVELPVRNGHAPAAEQCDPKLKSELAAELDVYKRQLILLSWYFEQFYYHLPNENIIRYEDVISTGGKTLSCISASAIDLSENLTSKNNNALYNSQLKSKLLEMLLDSSGYYWKYYSKESLSN